MKGEDVDLWRQGDDRTSWSRPELKFSRGGAVGSRGGKGTKGR